MSESLKYLILSRFKHCALRTAQVEKFTLPHKFIDRQCRTTYPTIIGIEEMIIHVDINNGFNAK